jgi:hypothetical protein
MRRLVQVDNSFTDKVRREAEELLSNGMNIIRVLEHLDMLYPYIVVEYAVRRDEHGTLAGRFIFHLK